MTQLGNIVSQGPFIGGVCRVSYHRFFRAFSRIIISMFVLAMSVLHIISREWSATRLGFKFEHVCNRHQWDGECS
jgi:hypothetical protein